MGMTLRTVRHRLAEGLPPHAVARSAVLSRRHGAWGPFGPHITASWRSQIQRHPDAVIEMAEHATLNLGHWPSGPPSAAPALLHLHEGSTLRMTGWVVLGGGSVVVVGPGATLEMHGNDEGEGVIVSTGARILCMEHIRLGAGTGISWDAQVLDTDQHYVGPEGAAVLRPRTAPVVVGECVLIASRASVLKGVTIGDGAVIGAGSVVTRDVPAHSVAAGNPARVVQEGIRWF